MAVYTSRHNAMQNEGKKISLKEDLGFWGTGTVAGALVSPYLGMAILGIRLLNGPAYESKAYAKDWMVRAKDRVGVEGGTNYHTKKTYPYQKDINEYSLLTWFISSYFLSKATSLGLGIEPSENAGALEKIMYNVSPIVTELGLRLS